MSNNDISVIKKRLRMLDENKLINHDECRVLLILMEEIGDSVKPIVHCKDCALRVPGHVEISIKGNMIRVPDTCKLIRGYIKQIEPDGFCAWGERKVVD